MFKLLMFFFFSKWLYPKTFCSVICQFNISDIFVISYNMRITTILILGLLMLDYLHFLNINWLFFFVTSIYKALRVDNQCYTTKQPVRL